jgi:hypothetical protein
MGLLNVSLNFVAYSDTQRNIDPRVKFCDFHWSLLGLPFNKNPKEEPISLSPGETKAVISTERTLSFTGGTSFQVQSTESLVRLVGTFGQRTSRTYGDATTQWSITKSGDLVTATWTTVGTAPNFLSMVAGDGVTMESPFSAASLGDFIVVKVGSNYIQFLNPFAVVETVTGKLLIYSSGPVQVGDTLDLSSAQFSFPNHGQFQITRVTDAFIEFYNQSPVPEVVTGVTSGFSIYSDAYQWMLMACDQRLIVRLNNDSGSGVEVTPDLAGNLDTHPGLYLKRGKVFKAEVYNPNEVVAEGFIFLTR